MSKRRKKPTTTPPARTPKRSPEDPVVHDATTDFVETYPREITDLAMCLQRIRDRAGDLGALVHDLYFLAHDRTTSGEAHVTTSDESYDQLATHQDAQRAWTEIVRRARATEIDLNRIVSETRPLLKQGRDIDPRYRPGRPISKDELDDALRAQRKRQARGEYSPVRTEPQRKAVGR